MYFFVVHDIYRAGSKKHAGRLNIYGTPTARDFPVDLKAVEGREFILHCPMGGYPLGMYIVNTYRMFHMDKVDFKELATVSLFLVSDIFPFIFMLETCVYFEI